MKRRFYVAMSLVAIGIVMAGFGLSIINPGSRRAPLTLLVAAHGVVFLA